MHYSNVAVLMACFNGSQWIRQQLESILAQQNVSIDLYISDDFSIDNTYEIVENVAQLNSNINILPLSRKFGGAAKNFYRLIKEVDFEKYDYVCLSDQDDIWLPNKLAHGLTRMEDCGAEAYSSDVLAFWDDGSNKLIKKSYRQRDYDFLFEAAGPGCTYIFTSSSISKFKLFLINNWIELNEISLHDWIIYAYYRSNNLKWLIDEKYLMLYRQHNSNQIGVNVGFFAFKKRWMLIKSKWYSGEVAKIARILNMPLPDRIFMIKNFRKMRRRPRDAFILLFANLIGFF